jgi:hypothetical protein
MNVPVFVMGIARGTKAERLRRLPSAALMVTAQAPQRNGERHHVRKIVMRMTWVGIRSLGS